MALPVLVDKHGAPLRASAAHHAADPVRQSLAAWHPHLGSADSDYLPERDSIAARVHDLVRNDGWASGGIQKLLDNAIGGMFRLQAEPDFRALGQSRDWAREWSGIVESEWRGFAEDPDCFCDAKRERDMVALFGLMFGHRLIDGECLGVMIFADRGGDYATGLQVIDPDRLSNRDGATDTDRLRGGVELGADYGEPLAYHIRKGHPGDHFGFGAFDRYVWDRVPRETSFGRRIVIHDFEARRAGQTRGQSSMVPIVKKLKQLGDYDEAELGASLINAILAAFITSPFDHEMLGSALGGQPDIGKYQDGRVAFHEESRQRLGGVKIPILYPGEDFKMTSATRPATAFASFEEQSLRNVATAMGLSYEQLAMDWSKTNYSSARAALLEVWKNIEARRRSFGKQTARVVYGCWLEEAIDLGRVPVPPGAPDFHAAKAAWTGCSWNGPGRGWVDPVKEAQAAAQRMAAGLSTLKDECAQQGRDYRDVLEQRAREIAEMEALGLEPLSWAEASAAGTAPGSPPPPQEPAGG